MESVLVLEQIIGLSLIESICEFRSLSFEATMELGRKMWNVWRTMNG